MHRGAEEHTELVALIASAARCFRGDGHVVTIEEFGAIPTVVLAAASEVYRGELAFGGARTTLAMSAVRFPGAGNTLAEMTFAPPALGREAVPASSSAIGYAQGS